jgi:hypothetical protein
MPVWFGLGFIAPLTAQILQHSGLVPPMGLSPLVVGLVLGVSWGGLTVVRGRWI